MKKYIESLKRQFGPTPHYYGDIVRVLFLFGALIMLFMLPILNKFLPVNFYISILVITTLGIIAGITNPLQAWTAFFNSCISVFAFIVFEYFALQSYFNIQEINALFLTNQILALNFFVATYYSVKTLRGEILNK